MIKNCSALILLCVIFFSASCGSPTVNSSAVSTQKKLIDSSQVLSIEILKASTATDSLNPIRKELTPAQVADFISKWNSAANSESADFIPQYTIWIQFDTSSVREFTAKNGLVREYAISPACYTFGDSQYFERIISESN